MHVYNLQTETSNIFLFVSEELEKYWFKKEKNQKKKKRSLQNQ